jgi:hypothetical protein
MVEDMSAVRVAERISPPPREEVSMMTTPQPANAPNAPVAVKPATPAIFAIVGGALGIIGFFLPWEAYTTSSAQGATPHTVTYSFWDITNHSLTGANLPGTPPTGQPTSNAPYLALVIALPAVLALVALVAGGVAVMRGLGPVLSSLIGAAGLMGVVNGEGVFLTPSLVIIAMNAGTSGASSPAAFGVLVMQVGFFVILVGGIMGVMAVARARRAGA